PMPSPFPSTTLFRSRGGRHLGVLDPADVLPGRVVLRAVPGGGGTLCGGCLAVSDAAGTEGSRGGVWRADSPRPGDPRHAAAEPGDRKSTRLNSSHSQ